MIKINKIKILLIVGLTLCSALVAESLFGLGKTPLQKFESYLEKQKEESYEANLAKALQYVHSKSGSNYDMDIDRLVAQWGDLDEAKKSRDCFEETLRSVKYIEDELKENELKGVLSRILNPLLNDVKEICKKKAKIYSKGREVALFTQANNLLLENTKSDDIIDNIEVAKELLANTQNADLKKIFGDFVALRPIVEQNNEGKLVCSDENMDLIKAIQDTMAKSIFFDFPRIGSYRPERLEQFVITITEQVGKVCLKPLAEQFLALEPKLDYDRVRALKQFSGPDDSEHRKPKNLVSKARFEGPLDVSEDAGLVWANIFVRMNVALYGEHKMCKWDPLEQRHYAPIEFVQEKFDDLVVNTCKHIVEREDLVPIIEETLRVARKVQLYQQTLPGVFVKNGLADVAANYVVCKRLENVDQSKLVENIAENLQQAELFFVK